MKPIKNKFTNVILGHPVGWDSDSNGPCIGLPVCMTEDPFIYSWWSVSWRERIAILFGRPVRMCTVGVAQPPVSLEASGEG